MDIEDIYYKKYIKYKTKYLELKQSGGKKFGVSNYDKINNQTSLLKLLLSSLIPEHIQKTIEENKKKHIVMKMFTKLTSTKESTDYDDFQYIIDKLQLSMSKYHSFDDGIKDGKTTEYYYDTYQPNYISFFNDLNTEISNKITSIKNKYKNNLDSYNNTITGKIKLFNEKQLEAYNIKDVNTLTQQPGLLIFENILKSYFNDIQFGLKFSEVNFIYAK
jgi:hypothetical protein